MNKKEVSKNYYTNTKRKIMDFLMGFFGFYIALIIIFPLIFGIFYILIGRYFLEATDTDFFSDSLLPVSITIFSLFNIGIPLLIFVASLWFFAKNKRYFIVLGLTLALPLIPFAYLAFLSFL